MLDCIIIGAGPAGATAGYHLAKKGRSILVLDKTAFPRYKPCGGGVSPAIARWFDFDFTPVIESTVTRVRFTWQQGDPVTTNLTVAEPMWMVKRDHFDEFLCQQAIAVGASIQDNTEVMAIAFSGDRWQVTTSAGIFHSRYLIAADGVKGPTSRWLGGNPKIETLGATLEISTPVPSDRLHTAIFEFGSLKNGYIWTFPKKDGYTLSGGCFKGKIKPEELKNTLLNYAKQAGLPLENAHYVEYPLHLWQENRPLHRGNALIAGEAAGILDPLIGEGVRPAILTGVKAAEAIDRALAGDSQALSRYSQIIREEWGEDMALAGKLAGMFYQFPQIAYKVAVKRSISGQMMGRILAGELKYRDVTDWALDQLKKRLLPGFGWG
jgi:geranylgeranyl reductase family protein